MIIDTLELAKYCIENRIPTKYIFIDANGGFLIEDNWDIPTRIDEMHLHFDESPDLGYGCIEVDEVLKGELILISDEKDIDLAKALLKF